MITVSAILTIKDSLHLRYILVTSCVCVYIILFQLKISSYFVIQTVFN